MIQVRVLEVDAVDAARFHARFSARERKYVYRLVTGRRCVRGKMYQKIGAFLDTD